MQDDNRRTRETQRSAAIAAVEAAYTQGRIVGIDRDKRIAELRGARSTVDIVAVTRDLVQAPSYPAYRPAPADSTAPSVTGGAVPPAPPSWATYPATSPAAYGSTSRNRGSGAGLAFAIAAVVVGAAFIAMLALGSSVSTNSGSFGDGEAFDEFPMGGPDFSQPRASAPKVASSAGIAKLTRAVEEQTGSTQIVRLILRNQEANVRILRQDGVLRDFVWNGRRLRPDGGFETSDEQSFDLTTIDAEAMVDLLTRARLNLVDRPIDSYVIVQTPDPEATSTGEQVWVTAYGRNRANQIGLLAAGRDGTLIEKRTFQQG